MIYDFNIPYASDAADLERIEKILDRLHSFDSHSIVALNTTVREKLADIKPIAPIAPTKYKTMQQLTRATIIIDDPKKNYQLAVSSAYPNIDILAARPTTIDICKHACQTLEVDMISLDLAKSKVAPGFVAAQVAVTRGIFFEICYSQSFRDPAKKFAFFSAVKRLVEVTRGHNLIFSSEAIRALEIRRPADIRILGQMFGMTQDQIEQSLSVNYARLLKKAETRKKTYNAVVGITVDTIQLKRKETTDPVTNSKRAKKAKK